MSQSIYSQRLLDRDLWVDGSSSLHVDAICNRMLESKFEFFENDVISEDVKDEVKKFVSLVGIKIPTTVQIKSRSSIKELDTSFNLPEKYLDLHIEKKIIKGFKSRHKLDTFTKDEEAARLYRIADELELYNNMGLMDVLNCAVYIVETLKHNNVVWGPGRGSACCSYILYLLEIHDIDSYEFDLSINEFLR